MSWTDERVAKLKELWNDGKSASQIAKQLGSCSRNAVIGKVHRLGLAGRATPSRPAKPRSAYKAIVSGGGQKTSSGRANSRTNTAVDVAAQAVEASSFLDVYALWADRAQQPDAMQSEARPSQNFRDGAKSLSDQGMIALIIPAAFKFDYDYEVKVGEDRYEQRSATGQKNVASYHDPKTGIIATVVQSTARDMNKAQFTYEAQFAENPFADLPANDPNVKPEIVRDGLTYTVKPITVDGKTTYRVTAKPESQDETGASGLQKFRGMLSTFAEGGKKALAFADSIAPQSVSDEGLGYVAIKQTSKPEKIDVIPFALMVDDDTDAGKAALKAVLASLRPAKTKKPRRPRLNGPVRSDHRLPNEFHVGKRAATNAVFG